MRTRIISCGFVVWTVLSTAGALALPVAGDLEVLRDRVTRQGTVRVIVEARPGAAPSGAVRVPPHDPDDGAADEAWIDRAEGALIEDANRGGAEIVHALRTLPVVTMVVDASALERLSSSGNVRGIWEDSVLWPSLTFSAPFVGAPAAWADGWRGQGQTVVIVDTGVDGNHPFFESRVVEEGCFSTTWNRVALHSVCPSGRTTEIGRGAARPCQVAGCEHGTHVAGIAAGHSASMSGIAPGASIMALQVFSEFDDPQVCRGAASCVGALESDVMRALEYVYARRSAFSIAAVNLSLGRSTDGPGCLESPLRELIGRLATAGIVTVAAAGNQRGLVSIPACVPEALSVGSEDRLGHASDFSSIGEIYAPGESILSAVPGGGFEAFSGTSMAAPHVTGALAVIRSQRPQQNLTDLVDDVVKTSNFRDPYWREVSTNGLQLDWTIAPLIPHIDDGSFERGLDGPWYPVASPDRELIVSADDPTLDVPPIAGGWLARLGGDNQPNRLCQSVYSPPGQVVALRYERQIRSTLEENCAGPPEVARVGVNLWGGVRDSFGACASDSSSAWEERTVRWNGEGRPVSLEFFNAAGDPTHAAYLYIDDVSLVAIGPPEVLSPAGKPEGPLVAQVGVPASYTLSRPTSSWDPDADNYSYVVDWGDGLIGEKNPDVYDFKHRSKIWTRPGTYEVRSRATSGQTGQRSPWSEPLRVKVVATPPGNPAPDLTGRWSRPKSHCGQYGGPQVCWVNATFFLRNAGRARAVTYTVDVYLADGPTAYAHRTFAHRYQGPILRPGDSTPIRASAVVQDGGSPVGLYLVAMIDDPSQISEQDEANNTIISKPAR